MVEGEIDVNGGKLAFIVLQVSGGHVAPITPITLEVLSPNEVSELEETFAEAGRIAQRQRDNYDEERGQ